MPLQIYQAEPRLVFSIDEKVYKFFGETAECETEVMAILSSPMKSRFDSKTNYTMKLVEIIDSQSNCYVMGRARGNALVDENDELGFYLAGRWLKLFHEASCAKTDSGFFLFGDYVSSHLYFDSVNKEVTVIDPGSNFGKVGRVEEDVARFVVGTLHSWGLNFFLLRSNLLWFIDGYGTKLLDFDALDYYVNFRILRSYEKAMVASSSLKSRAAAVFWRRFAALKYLMLKKMLRVKLSGN